MPEIVNPDARFWRGRPVLLTGGGGFLGSHVTAMLQHLGADLCAPRRAECDLTDAHAVEALFQVQHPDLVIHMAAAVGGIGANQAEPGRFFFDNARMGLLLVDAAQRAGVRRFVGIGTTCSYPATAPMPLQEQHFWDGAPDPANAPYGHSKRMLVAMGDAYRRQYGFDAIHVIPTNLYGPGDHFDLETSHVIPALIRKFEHATRTGADEVVCWGDGTPTREFLHVRDAARGILLAAEACDHPGPVNLGTGIETPIRVVTEMVASICGFSGTIAWDTSRPNGATRRCLDTSVARRTFGFDAAIHLPEGLAETLAWWREHRPLP